MSSCACLFFFFFWGGGGGGGGNHISHRAQADDQRNKSIFSGQPKDKKNKVKGGGVHNASCAHLD